MVGAVLVLLAFGLSSGKLTAQLVGTGSTQLNAFGNLQFSSEQDLNGVLGGSLTRFLTDQFEVGVTSLLLFTNGDIGGSLGGLLQFNVTNQSLWLAYAGVSSGVLWIGGETLGGVRTRVA
ncbi:MAG: hypothetical protein HKN73_02570 [Gemmatimonadetes bacterium]|nr:hypothetical protein [Gemmatimonadota bacterium]